MRLLRSLSVTVLALPALAVAETATLEPIVVTPALTEQTLSEAAASVTVIDREDIQRSGAQALDQLLQGEAGVSVTNTGGFGKQTGLFLRGTESNQTQVLIDGVRLNTPASGTALIQHIPASQIDRVEVVRGPRSSLYGSDAVGGVVQVFTRRPEKALEASSSATLADEGTSRLTQYLGGVHHDTRWDLTASNLITDGFDAQRGTQPDDDGYDNLSVNAGVEHSVTENLALDSRFYRAEGETDFDAAFAGGADSTEFVQQIVKFGLDYSPTDSLRLDLHLSQAQDRATQFAGSEQQGSANVGKRNTARLLVEQALGEQLLTLGLERLEEDFESASVDEDRYNNAVFIQAVGGAGPFHYQAAVRHDENQQFGGEVTGNLALGVQLHPRVNLFTSYGRAFVVPTFNDLFFPGFSNPNLEPEQSDSVELGIKGRGEHWKYSLTGFYSQVEKLITFANGQPFNLDETDLAGGEAMLGMELLEFWLELSVGYTRAEDEDDRQLIRRPEWTGNFRVRRDFGNWGMNLALRGQSDAPDLDFSQFPSQRVQLGGFLLADAGVHFRPTPDLTLRVQGRNLFDKDSTTVQGFNSQDRQVLGSVELNY